MKPTSLWIIRVALTVQFLGVLAVPTLVAAADSPRAMWMAEWVNPIQGPALSEERTSRSEVRPESNGRTIGVLRIRDGRLSFVEQLGQIDWELELANVKKVSTTNGGHSLWIVAGSGEEYVLSIMEANMTQASPKKAASLIEHAIESVATNSR
jgi:hypothetical protein